VQETPAVVVPVGAPQSWFETAVVPHEGPLRLIFYGLHTPLQGTPVMGRAIRLALEAGAEVQVTIIGEGQELAECKAELGDRREVTWLPWVAADDLPHLVSEHDVCLGIFGTTPKARRVVPNKVFQGAAAGCVLVTSDTPPQRRLLGEDTIFVPPGNASVLAQQLCLLADQREQVETLRLASRAQALRAFQPAVITASLLAHVQDRGARG
jgi:glycosyltransferase involved in cell wall biosynthesis